MTVPANPKLYHIVHVDRVRSIIDDGYLWSDALMRQRDPVGTAIGMSSIKQRRLTSKLSSRPGLCVGACVPFYFCPRSVMLYVIHRANSSELSYKGGQTPIVHLEFDLSAVVGWAKKNSKRWAFTLSNAGSHYFQNLCNLAQLNQINWQAIGATDWSAPKIKEDKQAEFLVEDSVPWSLVQRIGVRNNKVQARVSGLLQGSPHKPVLAVIPGWYY